MALPLMHGIMPMKITLNIVSINSSSTAPGGSERPIIGLTDNRLYRQADNLSVSADRQFCLSAIDRYTWIRPITIESANISSYRHILVSIVPISHQDY